MLMETRIQVSPGTYIQNEKSKCSGLMKTENRFAKQLDQKVLVDHFSLTQGGSHGGCGGTEQE